MITTPWDHVHIEYDEATGGYKSIEFCDAPQPATEERPHKNLNTGELCDCTLGDGCRCYVDPDWELTSSGSDPSNGTS